MSNSLEKWPACYLGRLSLFAENNLRVLANRFEWHPATVLFVYSVRLSLPELPACLYLGLRVTHLQPPQQTYCWGRFRHWKCWRLENGRNAAGESGIIHLFWIQVCFRSSQLTSLSLTPLAVCDWHWAVIATGNSYSPWPLDNENSQFQAAVCPWLTAPCGPTARGQ